MLAESGIYFKGDAYKGMWFRKFDKPETSERVITELNKSKP